MHGKVNNKIDVYAFGVVLLELISGRNPLCTGCPKGQESLVMWVSSIHLYHLPLCANFTFGLCTRNGSFLWLKQIINCCLFSPGKFHHTRRKARTTCRSQLTYWRPLWWSWEDDPCCFPLHQTSTSEPSSNWCCKFFFPVDAWSACSCCLSFFLQAFGCTHQVLKLLKGDIDILKWARSQVGLSYEVDADECVMTPPAQGSNANIQSYINLAFDVDDDSASVTSTDFIAANTSLEEYLKGRWSRSSSFDWPINGRVTPC